MRKSSAHEPIEREGPIPLYKQIESRLIAELKASSHGKTRIFSDSALMKRFGVSRMTVRNAVADLVRQGIVKRIPGRGTFLVPPPPVTVQLDGLERFVQEWQFSHPQTPVRVPTFRYASAPAEIAKRLQIAPGKSVLLVRRLREDEGEPVILDIRYVAPWCTRGITREDVSRRSLFLTIAEKSGIEAVAVEQEIGAQAADANIARALHIKPRTIVLRRQVTFFASDERPILTGVSFYRADHFTFQMRATR